jgi:hypothetical protein
MAITKNLNASELKEQNKVSAAAGFEASNYETVLGVGEYSGFATGLFNELCYNSKKVGKGRINFAVCEFEDESGNITVVDVPIKDSEIDECVTNASVTFLVFHPEDDVTQTKRVKLVNVDAVVTPPVPAAAAPAAPARKR